MKKFNFLNVKIITSFAIVLMLSLAFFSSCNKDELQEVEDLKHLNNTEASEGSAGVRGMPHWDCGSCAMAGSSIEENMDLAARAFASTLTNHTDIKSELQSEISAAPLIDLFSISGMDAIDEVNFSLGKDLPGTLQSELVSHSQNALDTCILQRFKNTSFPLCCLNFYIRIPRFNEQDKTKPIIVFPIFDNLGVGFTPQEDANGYFIDPSGNLTSMTRKEFDDEDEEDNFFEWNVLAIIDCDQIFKEPGCDNDGICEPLFGETSANCEDCQNLNKNPGIPTGTLYLKEIESLTDTKLRSSSNPSDPDKKYQEWHYNGKYELAFQYAIFNTSSAKVDYQFVIDEDAHNDDPYRHNGDIVKEFKSWGNNAEIKRRKEKKNGSFKANSGVHTIEDFNQAMELSEHFAFDIDEVYFLLYEKDWKLANPKNVGYDFGVYINEGNVRRPYTHNYSAPNGVQDFVAIHGAANGGTSSSTLSNPGTDIMFIDNDPSNWTPAPPIGGKQVFEFESTLDGEFRIKFMYIEN